MYEVRCKNGQKYTFKEATSHTIKPETGFIVLYKDKKTVAEIAISEVIYLRIVKPAGRNSRKELGWESCHTASLPRLSPMVYYQKPST